MNRCGELREQLEDVALGFPASSELSDHLAGCAACAVELERQRVFAQRVDDAVRAVVRAEPPPQLLAGVRARLSTAPPASFAATLRPRIVIWTGAAACALILALGFRAVENPPVARPSTPSLATWRSPTDSLLASGLMQIQPRPSPERSLGGSRGS